MQQLPINAFSTAPKLVQRDIFDRPCHQFMPNQEVYAVHTAMPVADVICSAISAQGDR
jgi:hypothetical protein